MNFTLNRLVLVIGSFVLLLALLLFWGWPARQDPLGQSGVAPQLEPRDIVLYFADPAGASLASEERQIPGCNEERQCIAKTIEALATDSKTLQAILPEGTRVVGVEIEGDLARINFSRELINRHPGGSLSELLTVYGLANTLTVNFPSLERLQILVEGQVQATLKGHVDISHPIKPEFSYSQIPDSRPVESPEPVEGRPSSGAVQN